MSSYQSLYDDALTLLRKHRLDAFVGDISPDLINILLAMHRDKLVEANSYDTAMAMINKGASAMMKLNLRIESFLKTPEQQEDLKALYKLFEQWRVKFLAQKDAPDDAVERDL